MTTSSITEEIHEQSRSLTLEIPSEPYSSSSVDSSLNPSPITSTTITTITSVTTSTANGSIIAVNINGSDSGLLFGSIGTDDSGIAMGLSSSSSSVPSSNCHDRGSGADDNANDDDNDGEGADQDNNRDKFDKNINNISRSSSSLSVRFAPLPNLAPRKRKSSAPLGMAARGQLVGRRRRQMGESSGMVVVGSAGSGGTIVVSGSPIWTPEELQRQTLVQQEIQRRWQEQMIALEQEEDEEEEVDAPAMEDPLLSFGKFVKGASKQLWKKVADKGKEKGKEKTKEKEKKTGSKGALNGEDKTKESRKTRTSSVERRDGQQVLEVRGILAPITPNVVVEDQPGEQHNTEWKENLKSEFPGNVGQTDTIIEGRSKHDYSWSADLDAHAKSASESATLENDDVPHPPASDLQVTSQ